ncbi:MAG: octaprenyl diphosphate synthase [Gammaproteobacteria bacterium]
MSVTTPNPTIEEINALVSADLSAVDQRIKSRLYSDVMLINQLSHYIIGGGGKRLRPILVLLSAKAVGYEGQRHIDVACIIELVHTATLLHDDVVDASQMRRGRETANLVWGNEASVLVGDFLYSRAFQMMVDLQNMRILEVLADATNVIAEGEVMQLVNCHDPSITEQRYIDTIRNKTAKLFEASTQLGVVLTKNDAELESAFATYGRHLGTAFQLIDDALDYNSSSDDIGKNIGDDLAEGKPTLPLLYAMWNGSAEQAAVIREAIENGGLDQIDSILETIESTGAITYTFSIAEAEAAKAKAALRDVPPSPYLDALNALAEFAVHRSS